MAQGFGADPSLVENVEVIPVMQLQDSDLLIKATIDVGELSITREDTEALLDEFGVREVHELMDFENEAYHQLFEEIMSTPQTNPIHHELNLTNLIKPFNAEGKGIVVTENGDIQDLDEYAASTSYASSTNWNQITSYYLANPIPYERTDDGLRVHQLGEENGIPLYRSIEEKGMGIREAAQDYDLLDVMTDAVGYYEVGDKEESLSSSPLGIYQMEPVTYVDEAGNETTLRPTFTAGSFVTAPAEGVTTIESAPFIKGEHPIDAIRVKVSGFDNYSPEAAKEINRIAGEISEMGLHTDIVAGSSLQKMDVEVEGIGTVQESWTTLGASGEIAGQWDLTNLLLGIIFTLVALLYVINRIKIWIQDKREDIELYHILGWEHKHIKKLLRKEIARVLLFAVGLSVVLMGIFLAIYELTIQLLLFQLIIIAVLTIVIFILVEGRMKKRLTEEKKEESPKVKQTFSLIIRNVLYYRKNIVSTFLQILIVSSLVTIVYLSLTESVSQSNHTVLGQYINAGVSDWNQLIIISTFLLTMITLVENISTMLSERKEEIIQFKIIGWNLSSIRRMYMKEIALWTGLALVAGSLLSVLLFFSFYPMSVTSFLFILGTAIGLYLFILIVSSMVLVQRLRKIYT